jgi:hypothetical protein
MLPNRSWERCALLPNYGHLCMKNVNAAMKNRFLKNNLRNNISRFEEIIEPKTEVAQVNFYKLLIINNNS